MLRYWIWLNTRANLGSVGIQALWRHFGSVEEIYLADQIDYTAVEGLNIRALKSLCDKKLAGADEILGQCDAAHLRVLTYQDAAYPNRLRALDDPPHVLYYSGTLPDFDNEPVIGMVGARSASAYGLLCAKRIAFQIASCGGIVVSGGARGIDTMSLTGALSAGRPVIAVLGCGADVVYPRGNEGLFSDIRACGCVLSEYQPGTQPLPQNFPVRNRIISGLSVGVVVVEASRRSGALITARHALEQGRDVFAIPGNIGLDYCAGSNQLLKDGAILAESGWDVMREYEELYPQKIRRRTLGENLSLTGEESRAASDSPHHRVASDSPEPRAFDGKDVDNPEHKDYIDVQAVIGSLSRDEAAIVTALSEKPMYVDDLIEACQLSTSSVLASLTLLEVRGLVQRLPARRFSLAEKS